MSVLNQKMDEQMPYFKRSSTGTSLLLGHGVWHTHICNCKWCKAQGVPAGRVGGVGSGRWRCIRPLKCAPVSKTQAQRCAQRSATCQPTCPSHVYLLLTQKRPPGRIAVASERASEAASAQPPGLGPKQWPLPPFGTRKCAEWLIIRRRRFSTAEIHLFVVQTRAVPEIMCARISND